MLGIDISFNQSTVIDFDALRESGVEFVIMKAGSSNTGERYVDSKYEYFKPRVRDAGLAVGGYWYNGLLQPADDAHYFADILDLQPGDFAVLDIEGAEGVPQWNADQSLEFDVTFQGDRGIVPMSYGSSSIFDDSWQSVHDLGSKLWVAQYGDNSGQPGNEPSGVGPWGDDWTIWQYSSNANFNGYGARLDANISRVDVRTIHGTSPSDPSIYGAEMSNLNFLFNTDGVGIVINTKNGKIMGLNIDDWGILRRVVIGDLTGSFTNPPQWNRGDVVYPIVQAHLNNDEISRAQAIIAALDDAAPTVDASAFVGAVKDSLTTMVNQALAQLGQQTVNPASIAAAVEQTLADNFTALPAQVVAAEGAALSRP